MTEALPSSGSGPQRLTFAALKQVFIEGRKGEEVLLEVVERHRDATQSSTFNQQDLIELYSVLDIVRKLASKEFREIITIDPLIIGAAQKLNKLLALGIPHDSLHDVCDALTELAGALEEAIEYKHESGILLRVQSTLDRLMKKYRMNSSDIIALSTVFNEVKDTDSSVYVVPKGKEIPDSNGCVLHENIVLFYTEADGQVIVTFEHYRNDLYAHAESFHEAVGKLLHAAWHRAVLDPNDGEKQSDALNNISAFCREKLGIESSVSNTSDAKSVVKEILPRVETPEHEIGLIGNK